MSDKSCAFCGHPSAKHRVYDAIIERIGAGEPRAEVLADYGLGESGLRALEEEVYPQIWLESDK